MNSTGKHVLHIAEQIVSVLPEGTTVRVCSDEREAIRYAVRSSELKLRSIVLGRTSLQRLLGDPAGPVKIEYLQRELLEAASTRGEFRYPREVRRVRPSSVQRTAPPSLSPRASAS